MVNWMRLVGAIQNGTFCANIANYFGAFKSLKWFYSICMCQYIINCLR